MTATEEREFILKELADLKRKYESCLEEIEELKKSKPLWTEKMETKQAISYINQVLKISCARNKFDDFWKKYNYFPLRKFEGKNNCNYFHKSDIDDWYNNLHLKTHYEAQDAVA